MIEYKNFIIMPFRKTMTTNGKAMMITMIGFQSMNTLRSQDFTTHVAESIPYSLYDSFTFDADDTLTRAFGLEQGIKGGFETRLGIDAIFDSNFRLEEDDGESEMIALVRPAISYTSDPEGGAPSFFMGNYKPVVRSYLHNSELNDIDHSIDFLLRTGGAKTRLSAIARYSEISGTDRLTRSFTTASLLNIEIAANYQVAPRTLLAASAAIVTSDYNEKGAVGSDIYTLRMGAMWAATERFGLGPSIRYILSESDNTGDIDAWALLLETRYKAGERINLAASFGLEHTSPSAQESEAGWGLTGDLSANYEINESWNWKNTIRYVTIPSPTETGYVINNLGVSTQLNRELLRASVSFGLDFNNSNYEPVARQDVDQITENNIGAFAGYRRKLFSRRLDFNATARYSINDGREDWSQLQISLGLDFEF
jgi:hypothetical protein